MYQPEELKKSEPLKWSVGNGTDVWELFCACVAGDMESVKRLLAKDPALVRTHYNYRKPLYFAVRENHVELAALLFDLDPDPINLWVNGSPLDICRDRGYTEMLQMLEERLSRKLGVSTKGEPVAIAIRERDLTKVKSLLDADPDLLLAGDERSNQPIHWAVMTRNLEMIDELLNRGADINARRADSARPIHLTNGDYHYRGWRDVPKDVTTTPAEVLQHLRARGVYVDINTAASIGDLDRVKELVDQDPTLANRVSDYLTYYAGSGAPLKDAAGRGHIEIVKFLLGHGADPNLPEEGIAPDGRALYSAVYNGHHEIAKLLLEHGAFPNPEVERSADALTIAMSNKDQQMVDLLYSYGATMTMGMLTHHGDIKTAAAIFALNPELANDPGALAHVAGSGNESFVRLLLHYQPDLAKRMCTYAKTPELTEFLIDRGMNLNFPNWLGITRLHEFAEKGNVQKAAFFIEHGADLNARDEDLCSTPLAWAAKFGKKNMVEFLLRKGAKPNLPDDPPWATPLAWATRRGHQEIVDLLNEFDRTGSLPPAEPEPEPSADPITGIWKDEQGITFELTFDGKDSVSGSVSPNGGPIKKGTFDPKTYELKLEVDAHGPDGNAYDLLIEAKIEQRTATGSYIFKPVVNEITGCFTLKKQ